MTTISRPLRLAEAVGALSLATDLAMGQPLEHGLRTAVLAVRIAQAMSLPDDDQVTVFYTGLLHFAGCTAESEIDARFFGDELSARPQMMAVAFGTRRDLGEPAYAGLDAPTIWDAALLAEPGPQPVVGEHRLDACLSAIADFADLKSMWTVGHSRGVAELAERAAVVAGLPEADQVLLRRAGLVHDIGRVAVPVNVWAKPGPLNRDEREQVRLHAYHTERVLDAAAGLRPLARLAGSHGERCDGSGYHRGSRSAELPLTAWLLAAADCYHAMGEPRPHRRALPAGAAARELSREADAGRLAADAVHAVLTAAGQPQPAGPRERRPGARRRGTSRRQPSPPDARQPGRPATGPPPSGRPGFPSGSARCSACWPGAWPPSRSRGGSGSRRRPVITTSSACTARRACPPGQARHCSRWNTGWSVPMRPAIR